MRGTQKLFALISILALFACLSAGASASSAAFHASVDFTQVTMLFAGGW